MCLPGIINLLTWTFQLVFIWYSCVLLGKTSDFKAILAGIQLFYVISMYMGVERLHFQSLLAYHFLGRLVLFGFLLSPYQKYG